jgi:hypothetical protein
MAHLEAVCDSALSDVRDEELRYGIGSVFAEASKRARVRDVDIVIVAARRMACLYELLVNFGMPEIEGCLVICDRVLDADPGVEWRGAKVLVLDDSVVVGTTLDRLHDELQRLVGKDGTVSFLCVCIDIEQCAQYLVDSLPLRTLHTRSSGEVREFATNIVRALFRGMTPFFSDYPGTLPISMTTERWTTFLASPDWHVADVTAPLLDTTDQCALAQVPTESRLDEILSRLPPPLAALVDGVKIRHYIRKTEFRIDGVIVPIALVAPARPSQLDDAFASITSDLDQALVGQLRWSGWSPEAKHRLIQLFASTYVLAEVWPALAEAADLPVDQSPATLLSRLPLRLYFGNRFEVTTRLLDSLIDGYVAKRPESHPLPLPLRIDQPPPSPLLSLDGVRELLWDTQELVTDQLPDAPPAGKLTKLGLVFSHAMASLFGFIYREHELKERAAIRSLGSRKKYRQLYGDPSRRMLNQGLTMRELAVALMPRTIASTPWKRSLVSLGVDAGNDLGVIVPETRYNRERDVVYRCYRYGETAHLAEWPLVMAFDAGEDRFDEMTRAAENGYPVRTMNVPIAAHFTQRRHLPPGLEPSVAIDLLRSTRYEALPGHVVSRFDGTITAVEDDCFDAVLRELSGEQRTASMVVNQVPEPDRHKLTPGLRFSWSVIVRDRAGTRDRVSRIRLRPMPKVDVDRLGLASKVLAGILADDPHTP